VGPYEKGCRGQFPIKSQLHCLYNNTNSPFLRLAPLKMELVGLDPYMVIYHDVISPSEILELQSQAAPVLKRATVFQHATGRNAVVKTRTSKVTWLPDILSPLTYRLNKRISDMTGFDLYGSEMLQMMNYGLGGHYDKHYDFFNSSEVSIDNHHSTFSILNFYHIIFSKGYRFNKAKRRSHCNRSLLRKYSTNKSIILFTVLIMIFIYIILLIPNCVILIALGCGTRGRYGIPQH